ncbi:methyl-accepting chemotaxis protein [Alkalithermobacter paradoxus]|uniref:Methyl-accepting chemotaxis protein McpB n=1 Tax=Alkalithermobacter paradoxus TaxID=29349 RepID=A0A1V4I4S8_9FIRM|nr:methyl-accepting chemotaxis protein McpB [[Clostridium] thermoalcaliphilum]
MKIRLNSIRLKIIYSILLCSIFIASLVGGVSVLRTRSMIEEYAQKELRYISENKGYEFENIMDNISSSVERLGDTALNLFDINEFNQNESYLREYINEMDSIIKRYSENTKETFGAYIYLNPELKNKAYGIWYADISGNRNFQIQEEISIDEFNRNNPAMNWYYNAVDNKSGTWIDPYMEKSINKYLISYTKPIYVDNLLIGVVGMDIDFDVVKDAVRKIRAYDTGYAFLLSKEYNFLAHPTLKMEDNLKNIDNGSLAFMADEIYQNKSGVISYKFKGEDKILGYSHLNNGYTLVTCVEFNEVFSEVNKLVRLSITIILLGVILAISISLYIGNKLTKPVIGVTDALNKTANLDISDNKEYEYLLNYKDECKDMGKSIIKLRKVLRDSIKVLHKNSKELMHHSTLLTKNIEESSYAIEEVSKSTDELATGATKQAQSAQEGLQKLEDLAKKIDILGNETKIIKEDIENTIRVNKEGVEYVSELNKASKENDDAVHKLTSKMIELDKSSYLISKAVSSIEAISDQTNLLALNAAIEAARAVDAGRGFVVVADEIRKLSQQASVYTKEIGEIVLSVQINMESMKKEIEYAVEAVKKSNEASSNAEKSFNEIDNAVSKIIREVSTFVKNIESINDDKDDVVAFIQEISSISQESAASTQQVSASVEEQFSSMEEISSSAEALLNIVKELDEIVNKFKI